MCEQCDRLWGLYRDRTKVQIKLLVGARWGRQYLSEALDRAESDRQWVRQALLEHSRCHEQATGLDEDGWNAMNATGSEEQMRSLAANTAHLFENRKPPAANADHLECEAHR